MGAFSTCEPSPCHSETASISGYSHTGSIASQTQVRENVKTLYTRVHNALVRHARRKEKRVVEIVRNHPQVLQNIIAFANLLRLVCSV